MDGLRGVRRYQELVIGAGALAAVYATSRHSYLLFHALAETFGVVVALCIFIIAWNARGFYDNAYLLLIGVASFFVGTLGLLHMLAYRGMGIFGPGEANLATQLWIAARGMESVSYLLAPLLIGRRPRPIVLFLLGAILTGLLLASILVWNVFPVSFVDAPGGGLTPFKIAAEYAICAVFAAALLLLYRRRRAFDPAVVRFLSAALAAAIAAEIAFTQYASVYGSANLLGHLLRIVSLYLVYKAIVQTALVRPYGLLFRELQQRERDLRVARATQEQTTQFLVHDMLNPLSGILGGVKSVLNHSREKLAPADSEMLEGALASGTWLATLTRALLDTAKLESGKSPVRIRPVGASQLVRDAVNHLSPWVRLRGEEVQVDVPEPEPTVMADPDLVGRVLVNVLGNSLRYSPPDSRITIRVSAASPDEIAFSVTDQGPGVPEGWIEKVFDRFLSASAREAGVSAFGLGLAFCKLAVEAQGGAIRLGNEPGGGATVTFTLPVVGME